MLDWYHVFIACVLLLWVASTPKDRAALRVVLAASLASEVIVWAMAGLSGAWKLAIPGAVEILTISALLQWAPNRTGYVQAALLVAAWVFHVICYADLIFGTDLVYSRYEALLLAVAVGQVAACHDTLFSLFRRVASSFRRVRFGRMCRVPSASCGDNVLRPTRSPSVQTPH